jgi:aspartate aminotransferase-like enzyme
VTAVRIGEGMDWKPFNAELKRRGLVLAGGQGKLTGQIFRLGHLGSVTVEEIVGAVGTLEAASLALGRDITPGEGVAAAQAAALDSLGLSRARAAAATA